MAYIVWPLTTTITLPGDYTPPPLTQTVTLGLESVEIVEGTVAATLTDAAAPPVSATATAATVSRAEGTAALTPRRWA